MDLPIYFISDIHLMLNRTKQEAKREEILFSFFDHVRNSGGTLIINGDLFDFYFEYKDVIPKVYAPLYYQILKLRESGVKVHYILGNHDYWVMDFINDVLFDKVYDDDVKLKSFVSFTARVRKPYKDKNLNSLIKLSTIDRHVSKNNLLLKRVCKYKNYYRDERNVDILKRNLDGTRIKLINTWQFYEGFLELNKKYLKYF